MESNEDVKEEVVESSTATTQDVNSVTNSEQTEETASTPENLTTQISDEEVDEKGVSYKNRYYEMKRKLEESVDSIPQIIDRRLQEFKQTASKPQEPQEYTVSQLEAFAESNPQHKAWVEEEKAKLIAKQAARAVEESFEKREKAREIETKKAQVYSKLQSEYPNLFVKDASGNTVGWDNSNPMVREIAVISQDPRLKDDPEGLVIATQLAHYRQLMSSQSSKAKETKALKAQVKNLEKQTFVEGTSGKPSVTQKDPLKDAINRAKTTGSKRDVEDAIGAYFKRAHLGG